MGADLLIRGGIIVTDAETDPGFLTDAGVLIRDGAVVATGPWDQIAAQGAGLPVVGGPDRIVLPGLINAHDHGRGISPQSIGIDDDLLEPWILNLSRLPALDVRLDTGLSALRQLQSGITTTINSYYHPRNDPNALAQVRQGYADAGLRAGIVLSAMDRPASADLMDAAAAQISPDLAQEIQQERAGRAGFDHAAWADLLRAASADSVGLTWMMAGPISAHWSSDDELRLVADLARDLGLSSQMHLLESRWQARDSATRPGGSIVAHLAALGCLGPGLSCAHGVHLTPSDMTHLAHAGVSVVTNPSSNMRLQSGLAPVVALRQAGVNVALGLDSMGLDDRTDIFDEMRLLYRLHGGFSPRDVIAMATSAAARAIGRPDLGRLTPGQRGDAIVLDPADRVVPGLSAPERVFDRIVHYGRPQAVRDVVVDGVQVLTDGRHATLDADQMLNALLAQIPEGGAAPDPRLSRLAGPLRDLAR